MSDENKFSRREFLSASALATAGVASAGLFSGEAEANERSVVATSALIDVQLHVNGKQYRLRLDPRMTLLDVLREHLDLTGTKKGCDHGTCGACTVHVDGRRMNSCLMLAVMAQGKEIATIEGVAQGEELHPMQQAFIDHDAFQCGYCTPGQIMSAIACVREKRLGSEQEIREYMSGNLCRCGTYPNIVAAIKDAAEKMEE